ncbi:hypothetical protein [uncultured Desulfobacter sp.]|uniref:hypothetical protein n=1 Tax=uncultured Desulfobacter sp. TaxID=240139 RepID=UPI0029F52D6A|nr:hypothetical protein [uncultured Desulfobacter sp.]
MSISDDIIELTARVEQILAMLEPLEKQGDESATLFADGVRHRLTELRKACSCEVGMRLATRLLDIVPSAKDLEAIDFRLDLHRDIRVLRSDIEAGGARIAKPLIDAL